FFSRVALSGDIGLGESYMTGEWEVDDLPGFIGLIVENLSVLPEIPSFLNVFTEIYHKALHRRRKNSEQGSQENIQAHYDLSNQMYQQFLDETMTYSSAVFETPDQSLEAAQRHKLQKIIKKARITADHHILEIGSGWGSFSIEAVQQTGCRVTTVTISEAQYQLAKQRIEAAGLSDRIDIKLCDYRRLEGQFDRIVSIEMIEAVGHDFLPDYFKTCDRLLKPNGLMVLQAITISDQRYDGYRKSSDWIRKHIFPGGHLPSLNAISEALTRHTSLIVEDLENIGPHYAPTLARWRDRFLASEGSIRTLGFDDTFCRKWLFYFAFCEAAFSKRYLNNLHLVLTRPNNDSLGIWGE
ncbi:MAG: cyclopropane-fatty-acyl-phospholipid synthase family protein, partial [Chloroflexota bacterium]